jgi:hypothetical protein
LIVALAFADTASAASFADRDGRWSCKPVERLAPLIEIDFEEREYRRCDQNICSAYDMTDASVRIATTDKEIRIEFGPRSHFSADLAGTEFVETVVRGENRYIGTGACEFRRDPTAGG